jgi:hypothetical protein
MGRPKAELTQDLVRSLVHYDPETGVFTWLQPTTRVDVGDVVGSVDAYGYLCTKLRGNSIKLHRLAWLYMTGGLPKNVDHINRNKADNRWKNLREVTDERVQQQNREVQRNNTTGVKGVGTRRGSAKFIARVRVGKRQVFYKEFDLLEDAIAARQAAEIKFHPYSPLNAEARVV